MEKIMTGDGMEKYLDSERIEGAISRQINSIERTIAELDVKFSVVFERLQPILADNHPYPGETAPDRPVLPAMGMHLYDLNLRLEELTRGMTALIDRIDL